MHSIWLSVLVPSLFLIVWGFPKTRQLKIWLIGIAVSLIGLALMVGSDVNQFLANGGKASHWWRRAILGVLKFIDVPIFAMLVGCCVNLAFSWRSSGSISQDDLSDSNAGPEPVSAVNAD